MSRFGKAAVVIDAENRPAAGELVGRVRSTGDASHSEGHPLGRKVAEFLEDGRARAVIVPFARSDGADVGVLVAVGAMLETADFAAHVAVSGDHFAEAAAEVIRRYHTMFGDPSKKFKETACRDHDTTIRGFGEPRRLFCCRRRAEELNGIGAEYNCFPGESLMAARLADSTESWELAAWAGYTADDDYAPDPELGSGKAGGRVIRYDGSDYLAVPSREDLVRAGGPTMAAVRQHAANGRPVLFMPVDVEDATDYSRGRAVYALRLYGHTLDGSKAEVTLTGIEPSFDVFLSDGGAGPDSDLKAAELRAVVEGVLAVEGDAVGARYEAVTGTPLQGYREAPALWSRVHLGTLPVRKKAMEAVRKAGFSTASDDQSNYFRKVARERGLTLSDWSLLGDYEYTPGPTARSPLSTYIFRVPVASYRPLVDESAPREKREAALATRTKTPLLARSRTLVVTWDLETVPRPGSTDLPRGGVEGDEAFMCCLTAHWVDDPEPLARICLVAAETAPDPRWLTVICASPADLIRALALALRALRPDIMTGFNDSDYDWPFIVEKASLLGLLAWFWNTVSAAPRRNQTDEATLKWNYRKNQKIKLSAEAVIFSSYLRWPGCVPIDTRVCFKKLYTKSDNPMAGSLRFYLGLCKLPAKVDLPHSRLWWAYRRALAAAGEGDAGGIAAAAECLRQAAHYCDTDAMSCQRLLTQRIVIADYRAVSAIARLSMADSHYYATGLKVGNLLAGTAYQSGILVSMQTREGGESGYVGAHVFPPEKGLVPDPICLAAVEEAAANWRGAIRRHWEARVAPGTPAPPEREMSAALGPDVPAEVEQAKGAFWATVAAFARSRPVTGLDFSSLYPSLIMAYNLSPEKVVFDPEVAAALRARGVSLHLVTGQFKDREVRAWFVRHDNDPARIGLYPRVLIDLFARRAAEKAVLGRLTDTKELIDLVYGRAEKDKIGAAEALRRQLADAEAEEAATSAALAPGAPPPRVSPGSTLAEEIADLRRRNKVAIGQAASIKKYLAGGLAEDSEPADAAIVAALTAEYERVCFEWVCSNSRQNALKVYMNSFYGETGNSLSPFYLLALAIGVTLAGQYNIKHVAEFVRGQGFLVKYGDSVAGDTPLIVRRGGPGGPISVARIDELHLREPGQHAAELRAIVAGRPPPSDWAPYLGDKEAFIPAELGVWSDAGFTRVTRVIRHETTRPLVRVVTRAGTVDCTRDHSLLTPDGGKVTPAQLRVGSELCVADDAGLLGELAASPRSEAPTVEEAWAWGVFTACGQVAMGGRGPRWSLQHTDRGLLMRYAAAARLQGILESGPGGLSALTPRGYGAGPTSAALRQQHYNAAGERRVPGPILVAALDRVEAYWRGLQDGAGAAAVHFAGKELSQGLWLVARRLGRHCAIGGKGGLGVPPASPGLPGPRGLSLVTASSAGALSGPDRRSLSAVAWVDELDAPGRPYYVYDLETENHHFHAGPGDLVVHNTDSLYIVPPNHLFAECDEAFALGELDREGWWSASVRITMRALNNLRDRVNGYLREDNGTGYLKMAYEEVLYPVVFTGKKKYFGIPHLNEVNFRPKKLFIKGVDVIKVGQAGMTRAIGERIMWAGVSLGNRRTMRRIVEDALREAITNSAQWRFEDFVKTDAWRPDKDNKSVKRFIERMSAVLEVERAHREAGEEGARPELYALPAPGDRFSYVIVKPRDLFTLRGCRADLKKGDRMEFARTAKALGLEIDITYYLIKNVAGLCARFVNGDAAFQPPLPPARLRGPNGELTEIQAAAADKASQKAAKKWIEALIKSLSGTDPLTLRRQGVAYRQAYAAAAASASDALVSRVGPGGAELLWGPWTSYDRILETGPAAPGQIQRDRVSAVVESLWSAAGDLAGVVAEEDGPAWCSGLAAAQGIGADGRDLSGEGSANLFGADPRGHRPAGRGRGRATRPQEGAQSAWFHALDRKEVELRGAFAELAPGLTRIAARFEADLVRLVDTRRQAEHESRPEELGTRPARPEPEGPEAAPGALRGVTEADRATLEEARLRWYEAVGVQLVRRLVAMYSGYLRRLRDRRTGTPPTVPRDEARRVTALAAARLPPLGLA